MSEDPNWKAKSLLLGALIGALAGIGVAYMVVRRAEELGERPKLGTGEGVQIGMSVLALLRRLSRSDDS